MKIKEFKEQNPHIRSGNLCWNCIHICDDEYTSKHCKDCDKFELIPSMKINVSRNDGMVEQLLKSIKL